jgi:hypothetical protein
MVGKAGEMYSIFLAGDHFRILAFNNVKNLNGLVLAGSYYIFSFVVEIERSNVGVVVLRKSEALFE